MPAYESIGLGGDKSALVIEIGAAFTKCGFTNESSPRAIVRSNIILNGQLEPVISPTSDLDEQLKRIYFFFEKLYFRSLAVNPKDRRVIIVESVFTPSKFRKALAKVLFSRFEIPSLTFVPSHLVSLITLAIKTALVVDIGFTECAVIPVIEGITVLDAAQFAPLGAQAIHQRISEDLQMTGCKIIDQSSPEPSETPVEKLDAMTLEDIKVRCCFVAPFERSKALVQHSLDPKSPLEGTPPPVTYPLDGQKLLNIPGFVRESAYQVLFEDNGNDPSLPKMMLDALVKCPLDTRRHLICNIVLIGGTVMAPGFKHRLLHELKNSLASDAYKKKLFVDEPAFHSVPCKENYAAWLGGAIFGSTEAVNSRHITKEQYIRQGDTSLKDWCD